MGSKEFWCAVAPLLDRSMPSALPSDCVVPLSYHALSPSFPRDLDVSLSGSEDEGLAYQDSCGSLKHGEVAKSIEKIPYKRPPGVKTLAQWGGLKFPNKAKAKFPNSSFKFVLATEGKYCRSVANRVVKQPYLLSFQHYMRAMENARRVATKRKELSGQPPSDKKSDSDCDRDDGSNNDGASSGWTSRSSS